MYFILALCLLLEIDIWTDEACCGRGVALLAEKLGFQWTKTYRLFYVSR